MPHGRLIANIEIALAVSARAGRDRLFSFVGRFQRCTRSLTQHNNKLCAFEFKPGNYVLTGRPLQSGDALAHPPRIPAKRARYCLAAVRLLAYIASRQMATLIAKLDISFVAPGSYRWTRANGNERPARWGRGRKKRKRKGEEERKK